MNNKEEVQVTKRLAADIPDNVFWLIKTATSERQLQMKEMIPLAVIRYLGLKVTPEELGLKNGSEKYLEDEEDLDREYLLNFLINTHPEVDETTDPNWIRSYAAELSSFSMRDLAKEYSKRIESNYDEEEI